MRVGVISGSGGYTWPGLQDAVSRTMQTRHGEADVTVGTVAGVEVVHLARHGTGHARLSNHVDHKANIAALRETGVDCVISLTVCGAVDPAVEPGSLIVFDDLYFPGNRLPDGSTCTWFDEPAAKDRGHWIFDRPFSAPVGEALISAAGAAGTPLRDRGCYGHVDGPRFNTRTEIAALAGVGVSAVSQTAGPEVVLAGEAELPLALVGFVTDYANGVVEHPEPIDALVARMAASAGIFADLLEAALPKLADLTPAGLIYRFTS
ncbi:MAG: MTAP family purine nucleoside phosphorylase [Catenulispora sp.]|nr:MTAP family purine nucleoside phosphorylase [Catenulispora sp.]NUR60258.1 MTAP family purine nucleoside phosphorylase [Catenulispora sp.]